MLRLTVIALGRFKGFRGPYGTPGTEPVSDGSLLRTLYMHHTTVPRAYNRQCPAGFMRGLLMGLGVLSGYACIPTDGICVVDPWFKAGLL